MGTSRKKGKRFRVKSRFVGSLSMCVNVYVHGVGT